MFLRLLWRRRRLLGNRGQTLVEFLLVLILAIGFARFIYFNQTFGILPNFDKMMLRLGSYLEANLKSGTRPGKAGVGSFEVFAGTNDWNN